jgi:hypothetical protein
VDHTYVDEKSLKSLEELVVFLGSSRLSLKTLIILQIKSIKAGIMPEDMNERASHIIGMLQDALALVEKQIDVNLDLLPENFKAEPVIERLKKKELTRARAMLRKPKEEKCDT